MGLFRQKVGLFRLFIYKYEYTELRPFTALTHRFGRFAPSYVRLRSLRSFLILEIGELWRRLTNHVQINKPTQQ